MKEYIYIGHYISENDNYILKIGTTNNPKRRKRQHNCYYKKCVHYPLKENERFSYDWVHEVTSKNTTLKVEKKMKEKWKVIYPYIPNDRFLLTSKPMSLIVTIRKDYEINLQPP